MNSKLVIATALVAFAGVGSAFAQEGTQDFPAAQGLSTMSRADAKAATDTALRNAPRTTQSSTVVAASNPALTRAQVMAEAREAVRLGLAPSNEGTRAATEADLESIRVAGQRAVSAALAQNR